jgi:hypothetical protein
MKTIRIPRTLVRLLLWASQFVLDTTFQIVCKGYNEDYENYTGLVWEDDQDLNPYDCYIGLDGKKYYCYEDFQIWMG